MTKELPAAKRGDGQSELIPPRDCLEYVADHLAELKTLAQSAGCKTLEGLLTLSEAEARRAAIESGGPVPQRT